MPAPTACSPSGITVSTLSFKAFIKSVIGTSSPSLSLLHLCTSPCLIVSCIGMLSSPSELSDTDFKLGGDWHKGTLACDPKAFLFSISPNFFSILLPHSELSFLCTKLGFVFSTVFPMPNCVGPSLSTSCDSLTVTCLGFLYGFLTLASFPSGLVTCLQVLPRACHGPFFISRSVCLCLSLSTKQWTRVEQTRIRKDNKQPTNARWNWRNLTFQRLCPCLRPVYTSHLQQALAVPALALVWPSSRSIAKVQVYGASQNKGGNEARKRRLTTTRVQKTTIRWGGSKKKEFKFGKGGQVILPPVPDPKARGPGNLYQHSRNRDVR